MEDPALFESTFGAPPSALPELLEAKTVTVSHLMTVVPAGTLDPSAVMHHEAFAALAGVLVVHACAFDSVPADIGCLFTALLL